MPVEAKDGLFIEALLHEELYGWALRVPELSDFAFLALEMKNDAQVRPNDSSNTS